MDEQEAKNLGNEALEELKKEGTVSGNYEIAGVRTDQPGAVFWLRSPSREGPRRGLIPIQIMPETLAAEKKTAIEGVKKAFAKSIDKVEGVSKATREKEERERKLLEGPVPRVNDPADKTQIERLVFYAVKKMEQERLLSSGWSVGEPTIDKRIIVAITRPSAGRQFSAWLGFRPEELTDGGPYMRVRQEILAAIDREHQRGRFEGPGPDEEEEE
jgi:hypothetical protein